MFRKIRVILFIKTLILFSLNASLELIENEKTSLITKREKRDHYLAINKMQMHSIEQTSTIANAIWESEWFEAIAWMNNVREMRQNIRDTRKLGSASIEILEALNELEEDCKQRFADLGTASFNYKFKNKEHVFYIKQLAIEIPQIETIASEDEELDMRQIIEHNLTALQLKSLMLTDDMRNQYCHGLYIVFKTLLPIRRQEAIKELQNCTRMLLSIKSDDSISQMQTQSFVDALKQLRTFQKDQSALVMRTIENISRINGDRREYLNLEEIQKSTEYYHSLLPPASPQPYFNSYFSFFCKQPIIIAAGAAIFSISMYLYWTKSML